MRSKARRNEGNVHHTISQRMKVPWREFRKCDPVPTELIAIPMPITIGPWKHQKGTTRNALVPVVWLPSSMTVRDRAKSEGVSPFSQSRKGLRPRAQLRTVIECVSHGRVVLKQWSAAVKFSSRDATVNFDAL
jgi:hypothetical protein